MDHAQVVGRVADRHDVLLIDFVMLGDDLKRACLIDLFVNELDEKVITGEDRDLAAELLADRFVDGFEFFGRREEHEFGDGDGEERIEWADEVGLEVSAGRGGQGFVDVVGVPLVQDLEADDDARVHLACELDDLPGEVGRQRLMEDVLAARHVVDECAVVVDLQRVEGKAVVDLADAAGRAGGGEDDVDTSVGGLGDGAGVGGAEAFVVVQQRAVQVDGDKADRSGFVGVFGLFVGHGILTLACRRGMHRIAIIPPSTATPYHNKKMAMTLSTLNHKPINDANRLGLDYRAEAERFAYTGPIFDIHTHINTVEAARLYFEVADLFNVRGCLSMTKLENCDAIDAEFRDRIEYIAVPNYEARDEPGTFTTDWLKRMEKFRERGCRIIKFWAAPRGRDLHADAFHLDSPTRRESIKYAYDLGYRMFMTHVGDPDTWFATMYADASKYGKKREHLAQLEELLYEYPDVKWIGAHMSGYPEDLDFVQGMLDRHPNYVIDTSATKWQVRELSKQPERFRELCENNPGRIVFGTDIVANNDNLDFDLYASRFWALRTLIETDYAGKSPIVDPDLHMVDPSVDEKSTADLRGALIKGDTLAMLYNGAAEKFLGE